jgi:glyoxylase-like metal-dependent hydrolase (beta-lactamase superfamily II)/8-oxo-dGTP pyrophosphatase MutT (NUDIX family)
LGGFHSFPGGKVDETDPHVDVRNCEDPSTARLIACVARETFEEVGVLIVRNGDRLTVGQIPLLHDDLISGRSTFGEILSLWSLWIDARDFELSSVWTTPEFSPARFRTAFFVAKCPSKQQPYAAITELQEVEFVHSKAALSLWSDSSVLIAPPVHKALLAVEEAEHHTEIGNRFSAYAEAQRHGPHYFELNSRLKCIPLRTKTLPPATHTNCFIVGGKSFVVIDAATPFEEEQEKLLKLIDQLLASGNRCEAIIVSHLHPDHFGGESVLKSQFAGKHGMDIPIVGHINTIESLKNQVEFDKEAPEYYTLQDSSGAEFQLDLLHTPGHARGHLCFYDSEFGFLLSSDNVVGAGSVVIAPPEGNMSDYLASLDSMKALPGLRSMCGSHGPAISDAKAKIASYIEHRKTREQQILKAISAGADDLDKVVAIVYAELDKKLVPLAKKSVEAHTERLESLGLLDIGWTAAAG